MKNIVLNISILIVASFSAVAQTEKDSLPGNPGLVSSKGVLSQLAAVDNGSYEYSVEDYFNNPERVTFRFSPNGDYLSYRERDSNGKSHIYVKNIDTDKTSRVIQEVDDLIGYYGWLNNNRLYYTQDNGGDENHHLFAVDLDGKNMLDLTPFQGITASIIDKLEDQKEYMIIQMNKENPQIFEPFKININTGELEKLFENKDTINPIANYYFDKRGILKAYSQQQNGTEIVLKYRSKKMDTFETIYEGSWEDNFLIQDFNYSSENPDDAYVISNLNSDTDEIILYDLKEKKILKKIYANDTFDIEGLSTSKKRDYEVDYYYYTGEKSVIIPVSRVYEKLHKKMISEFGDKEFNIVSVTDNEDKLLVYVSSDKLYGIYYAYDVKKDTFKKVFNVMPSLDPDNMATMKPIKFTSRDGLTLYGYLTIPNNIEKTKKVPLIVNPHGGPYEIRDSWGFNPESQLFASRGYATLQVNYRGSGGYGKTFYLAGSKQIGRNMLNDLEDAVAYCKTLNIIDPNNIAIYGASYGGLATLGSLVKTPDLYKCGVDYVGVSNLFTFVKSFPAYWKPYMKQFYSQWYDEENPEERKIMEEVSPALNVDKITKPLFVIQGANDPRVNINESDQVVENLRKRGYDIPYMVKYNEGHGFGHEKNTIELYKTMMGFFAKHLKN